MSVKDKSREGMYMYGRHMHRHRCSELLVHLRSLATQLALLGFRLPKGQAFTTFGSGGTCCACLSGQWPTQLSRGTRMVPTEARGRPSKYRTVPCSRSPGEKQRELWYSTCRGDQANIQLRTWWRYGFNLRAHKFVFGSRWFCPALEPVSQRLL